MTFVVSPRARYRHQVGGKFTLKLLELVLLAEDLCQCDMGHLGLDRLGRDRIRHGNGVVLNWHGWVGKKGRCLLCPNDICYDSDYGIACKSDV